MKGESPKDFYLYDLMTGDLIILFSGIVLGRLGCDVNFSSDNKMSGRHVELRLHERRLFIKDLGSKNRTRVNGNPIVSDQWIEIKKGDLIGIGRQRFEVTEEVVGNSTKQMKDRNEVILRQLDEKDIYNYEDEFESVQKQMTSLKNMLEKNFRSIQHFESKIVESQKTFLDELMELEKERNVFYQALENIKTIYIKRVDQILEKKESFTMQRLNLKKLLQEEKKQLDQMHSNIDELEKAIPPSTKKTG